MEASGLANNPRDIALKKWCITNTLDGPEDNNAWESTDIMLEYKMGLEPDNALQLC